jgi:hypothetical protein
MYQSIYKVGIDSYFNLVSAGIPALYQFPVPVQYRFLYRRSTDSCTGAVPIPVLVQYRSLYWRSTDSCTGAVPIPVLLQYRSMTKADIEP